MSPIVKVRLQKALAQAGVASRRKAEELIAAGKVEVNGTIVTEQGVQVEPDRDLIRVNGRLLETEKKVYFVLYKPPEVVTTLSDPQGRTTVKEYLKDVRQRVFAVGRLDYDAEGALIVTNDGDLANRLMHPRFQVPRVYMAKVKGVPDAATMAQAKKGVRLEDGFVTPLDVEAGATAERNTWVKLVLAEGRPHLVKRFFAAIGHPVVRLYRPLYGGVSAQGMRPGQLRPLTPEEVALLKNGGKAPIPPISAIKAPPRRHRDLEDGEEGQAMEADQGRTYTAAMEDELIFDGRKKPGRSSGGWNDRDGRGDFDRSKARSWRTHGKGDGRRGGHDRDFGDADAAPVQSHRWDVVKSHAQNRLDATARADSRAGSGADGAPRKPMDAHGFNRDSRPGNPVWSGKSGTPGFTGKPSKGGYAGRSASDDGAFPRPERSGGNPDRPGKPLFSKSGKFSQHGKSAGFGGKPSSDSRSGGRFAGKAADKPGFKSAYKSAGSDRFDHRVTGVRHGPGKGRR